ncbi:MAG TPA: CsiV family protein [Steroidobacteraceae bacterium]|jgi:hypothetical protein
MRTLALLRFPTLALLALIAGSASAQQPPAALQSYDVELVIFRTLSASATPEQWASENNGAKQDVVIADEDAPSAAAAAVAPVATSTETFPELAAAKFKLGSIEEALRRSRNYQVLGHIGWTQPGYPRTEAHYMSINGQVLEGSGLIGQIAVSRGRYLHMTLDLALEPPTEPGQRYVLQQTRRMRSNERHYIDHPKFGVIALITQSSGAE